jgi:hypothetical protein
MISRLLSILIVSWIVVCSAETNILSSRTAGATPSAVNGCNGGADANVIISTPGDYFVTICGSNFDSSVTVNVVGGFKATVTLQTADTLEVLLPNNGAGSNLKLNSTKTDILPLSQESLSHTHNPPLLVLYAT